MWRIGVTVGEDSADEDVASIASEIRGYLSSRPQAADSLEGVIKWWLLRQRYESSRREVTEALELLIKQGVVKSVERSDGTTIFMKRRDG